MDPKACLSPLQRLAAKWRVIGLIAVAFVQLLRRYEDGRTAGAQVQAEQLYVTISAAHILLTQETSETLETHPPETEADVRELDFLRFVSTCLLALMLVIQNIVARGLLGAPSWMLARAAFFARLGAKVRAQRAEAIPILDPG